jgi:hypothetical protein
MLLRMPALKFVRQERFCQLVKQGIPPFRAYAAAGYQPNNGAPYRFAENVRVKRRIAELNKVLAVKTRVTIETVTSQIVADRDFAIQQKQPATALAASVALGKLHGMFVDRSESGAPGEFAGLQSIEEVLARVREELGEETAALLAKALSRPEGEIIDQPAAPAGDQSSGEAERSLALFRSRPKVRRN